MIQRMGRAAELDPRPGATSRVDINCRDVARGEYVELDRPRRVVFTWGWGQRPRNARAVLAALRA